jgi:hypothetical protein
VEQRHLNALVLHPLLQVQAQSLCTAQVDKGVRAVAAAKKAFFLFSSSFVLFFKF